MAEPSAPEPSPALHGLSRGRHSHGGSAHAEPPQMDRWADAFRDQGLNADAVAGVGASNYAGFAPESRDVFLEKFNVPKSIAPGVAALQGTGSHLGGSPAHLSGAATPNNANANNTSHEHNRVLGSISPANMTSIPHHPQGPGSSYSNDEHGLLKPGSTHPQHNFPDNSGFNGGSHLINLDATPDPISSFPPQRGRHAQATPQRQQMLGSLGENWPGAGGGFQNDGSVALVNEMTDRMANLNVGVMQQQVPHRNKRAASLPNTAGLTNMMNPMMSAQMMQHGQLPRPSPSRLSMMTNQQLMMLAQTVLCVNVAICSLTVLSLLLDIADGIVRECCNLLLDGIVCECCNLLLDSALFQYQQALPHVSMLASCIPRSSAKVWQSPCSSPHAARERSQRRIRTDERECPERPASTLRCNKHGRISWRNPRTWNLAPLILDDPDLLGTS
jgi:hypothetical protein